MDLAELLGAEVTAVKLMEGKNELYDLPIGEQEDEESFTIVAHVYLYWPSRKSYTPLQYVKVMIIPLDSFTDSKFGGETDYNGYVEFPVDPYDPVSLVFLFDRQLKIDAAIDREHLLPVVAFVAGRPKQRTEIHIAMMTVRHLVLHYGVSVFARLYDRMGRSLSSVPDLYARIVSNVKEDLIALCYGEDSGYVAERLGDDYERICTWSSKVSG